MPNYKPNTQNRAEAKEKKDAPDRPLTDAATTVAKKDECDAEGYELIGPEETMREIRMCSCIVAKAEEEGMV